MSIFNRRNFIKTNIAGLAGLSALEFNSQICKSANTKSQVVVVKTQDRSQGVTSVINALDASAMKGKRVLIKPNFNTADPTPGSTHNDTMKQLITDIRSFGGEDITIGESSGPPSTSGVLQQKGILQMADELAISTINYEELNDDEWIRFNPEGIHWTDGFSIPRVAVESEYFVSTCCLKTHGFGGVFTMSLKLAVGLTPKSIRGGMHRSADMRKMIAELNMGYKPDLIILDGVEAFTDGGPSQGTLKQGNVFIGGTDRIAVDAVGLAVLKDLGANDAIMNRAIFEQEQIQRAVELGLGIASPAQIEIISPDVESRTYAQKLRDILDKESDTSKVEEKNLFSDISISNAPNPFNPATKISYFLPRVCEVSLQIHNTFGQVVSALITNAVKGPGLHEAVFNGNNLPSGMYFYNLTASGVSRIGKMTLVK
ncbi:DUF362 domain-containing protein [Candidatus Latescibacterota bacterium]